MPWANTVIFNNSILVWLYAACVTLVVFLILRFTKTRVLRYLGGLAEKTTTQWDNMAVEVLRRTSWGFLIIVALFSGSRLLELTPTSDKFTTGTMIIVFFLQMALWFDRLSDQLIRYLVMEKSNKDNSSIAMITVMGFIGRIAIWSVIVLMALDNLGFDITALIAGLGIGGVAVALAAQNILGDLFASISIVLDKPFEVGDFIIVEDLMGAVEYIGIKTTRVRSLSGEQLVFSNNDLLKSRIRNYKRMYERRVVFSLGVVYQTTLEQLTRIPKMVRETIEAQENTRFDRAHFFKYGDYALQFEIVYYVKSPDYNIYMDIQQAINLEIYRQFSEQGIEFAYPSQTLFLEKT